MKEISIRMPLVPVFLFFQSKKAYTHRSIHLVSYNFLCDMLFLTCRVEKTGCEVQ